MPESTVNTEQLKSINTALQQDRIISLSAAAEAANAIVVSGQIKDGLGNNVGLAQTVLVEVFAKTDAKGAITVVNNEGTELMNTGVPSAKLSVAALTTKADGSFKVSIANDQAETTILKATCHGADRSAIASLVFA